MMAPSLSTDRSSHCVLRADSGGSCIQQGPVAPAELPDRPVPEGASQTANALHHVALMRNAELVVKYLPGPVPVTREDGLRRRLQVCCRCRRGVPAVGPPTHDDWVPRALPPGTHERRFVKIALDRINDACREAAGYGSLLAAASDGSGIPLGEFADALAALMPGSSGPGARREAATGRTPPGRSRVPGENQRRRQGGIWVEGTTAGTAGPGAAGNGTSDGLPASEPGEQSTPRLPPPQIRITTGPSPPSQRTARP